MSESWLDKRQAKNRAPKSMHAEIVEVVGLPLNRLGVVTENKKDKN